MIWYLDSLPKYLFEAISLESKDRNVRFVSIGCALVSSFPRMCELFEFILGNSKRADCCNIYENNKLVSSNEAQNLPDSAYKRDPKKIKILHIAFLFMNSMGIAKLKDLMTWEW